MNRGVPESCFICEFILFVFCKMEESAEQLLNRITGQLDYNNLDHPPIFHNGQILVTSEEMVELAAVDNNVGLRTARRQIIRIIRDRRPEMFVARLPQEQIRAQRNEFYNNRRLLNNYQNPFTYVRRFRKKVANQQIQVMAYVLNTNTQRYGSLSAQLVLADFFLGVIEPGRTSGQLDPNRRVSVVVTLGFGANQIVQSTQITEMRNLTMYQLMDLGKNEEIYDSEREITAINIEFWPNPLLGSDATNLVGTLNFTHGKYCGAVTAFLCTKDRNYWNGNMHKKDLVIKQAKAFYGGEMPEYMKINDFIKVARDGVLAENQRKSDKNKKILDLDEIHIIDLDGKLVEAVKIHPPLVRCPGETKKKIVRVLFSTNGEMGHIELIYPITDFCKHNFNDRKFCNICNEIHSPDQLDCVTVCKRCSTKFTSVRELRNHCNPGKKCENCEQVYHDCKTIPHSCYSKIDCRTLNCSKCNTRLKITSADRYDEHIRNNCLNEVECRNCEKFYDSSKLHFCVVQPMHDNTEAGQIYVYDIECYYGDEGKQEIAVICVKKLDEPEITVYNDVAGFYKFLHSFNKSRTPVKFLAHNGAKYDSLLMIEALVELKLLGVAVDKIGGILSSGNKIFQFKLGPHVSFWDSYCHLTDSLDNLARTFNVPTGVKGEFPYKFFTMENANYSGEIPGEYYRTTEPHTIECTLYEECIRYCKQDVRLLSDVLTIYIQQVSENLGFNPMTKVTLAACSMYHFKKNCDPTNFYNLGEYAHHRYYKYAYTGGRCECITKYYKCKPGEKIVVDDIKSCYPAVQRCDALPGQPIEEIQFDPPFTDGVTCAPTTRINKQNCEYLPSQTSFAHEQRSEGCMQYIHRLLRDDDIVFFLEYDAVTPDYGIASKFPVAGILDSSTYLLKFTGGTIKRRIHYSAEIKLMVDYGYKFNRIYSVNIFESKRGGFNKYVETLFDLKSKAPKDRQKTWKLYLNSLYGKLGQHHQPFEVDILHGDPKEVNNTLIRYLQKSDSNAICDLTKSTVNENLVVVQFKNLKKKKMLYTTHIAAAITSCARARLYMGIAELDACGKQILYMDTDSLCYVTNRDDNIALRTKCVTWNDLGTWEREAVQGCEFVCLKNKTYSISPIDDLAGTSEGKLKCSGFDSNFVTHEKMVEIHNRCLTDPDYKEEMLMGNKFSRASLVDGVSVGSNFKDLRSILVDNKRKHINNDGTDEWLSIPLTDDDQGPNCEIKLSMDM